MLCVLFFRCLQTSSSSRLQSPPRQTLALVHASRTLQRLLLHIASIYASACTPRQLNTQVKFWVVHCLPPAQPPLCRPPSAQQFIPLHRHSILHCMVSRARLLPRFARSHTPACTRQKQKQKNDAFFALMKAKTQKHKRCQTHSPQIIGASPRRSGLGHLVDHAAACMGQHRNRAAKATFHGHQAGNCRRAHEWSAAISPQAAGTELD